MPINYKFSGNMKYQQFVAIQPKVLMSTKTWLFEEPPCKIPALKFEEFNNRVPPKV